MHMYTRAESTAISIYKKQPRGFLLDWSVIKNGACFILRTRSIEYWEIDSQKHVQGLDLEFEK